MPRYRTIAALFLAWCVNLAAAAGAAPPSRFELAEAFAEKFRSEHFVFHYNGGDERIREFSRFAEGYVQFIDANFFAVEYEFPINIALFESKADYRRFMKKQFPLSYIPSAGMWMLEFKTLFLSEEAGLATLAHEIIHPLQEYIFRDQLPEWAVEGLPSFFENFHGFWDGGKLHLEFGFPSPGMIAQFGNNLIDLDLGRTVSKGRKGGGAMEFQEQDFAHVSFFLWRHGKLKKLMVLAKAKDKKGFGTYLEAAFGATFDKLIPQWKEYLKDTHRHANEIYRTPDNRVFANRQAFTQWFTKTFPNKSRYPSLGISLEGEFKNLSLSKFYRVFAAGPSGGLKKIVRFADGFTNTMLEEHLKWEVEFPLNLLVLKDAAEVCRFLGRHRIIQCRRKSGWWIPSERIVVTHLQAGTGGIARTILQALVSSGMRVGTPGWVVAALPLYYDRFYGYWADGRLVLRLGFHDPGFVVFPKGDPLRLDLRELAGEKPLSRELTRRPESSLRARRLAAMFLGRNGKLDRLVELVGDDDKLGYPTFIEAAFEMKLGLIKPLWKDFLKNVQENRFNIYDTPQSRIFANKERFDSWFGANFTERPPLRESICGDRRTWGNRPAYRTLEKTAETETEKDGNKRKKRTTTSTDGMSADDCLLSVDVTTRTFLEDRGKWRRGPSYKFRQVFIFNGMVYAGNEGRPLKVRRVDGVEGRLFPLQAGNKLQATLHVANGNKVDVTFTVEPGAPADDYGVPGEAHTVRIGYQAGKASRSETIVYSAFLNWPLWRTGEGRVTEFSWQGG